MKTVTTIPATKKRFEPDAIDIERRKVAGYARVSTNKEEQENSFESQLRHYQSFIKSRSDWEYVGMYSDEGISATNTKRRSGFKQMIEDALGGKINLIITKSVSRFARNTVDSLTTIRKLKEQGIEVFFEKENIWTLDAKGELLITIMSSLAQEESRSISENTSWGKRKQMADGVTSIAYSRFLGYDKDFVIIPEEAETVRLIYDLFLCGLSITSVRNELDRRGIPTPAGAKKWKTSTVQSILKNEKYKGDALLQKTFTTDFLTKKWKKNEGELQQFYVTDHHEGIIDRRKWDEVQAEIEERQTRPHFSGRNFYSNKIRCTCCGDWYGRYTVHSGTPYEKKVFHCNSQYAKKKTGDPKIDHPKTPSLSEEEIQSVFLRALNKISECKREYVNNMRVFLKQVSDTEKLEREKDKLRAEQESLEKAMETSALKGNTEEYQELSKELRTVKLQIRDLEKEIRRKQNLAERIKDLMAVVKDLDHDLEFDELMWGRLVDHVDVTLDRQFTVVFKGGIEVKV